MEAGKEISDAIPDAEKFLTRKLVEGLMKRLT
jgi:hypothetical protein